MCAQEVNFGNEIWYKTIEHGPPPGQEAFLSIFPIKCYECPYLFSTNEANKKILLDAAALNDINDNKRIILDDHFNTVLRRLVAWIRSSLLLKIQWWKRHYIYKHGCESVQ